MGFCFSDSQPLSEGTEVYSLKVMEHIGDAEGTG
jgi:hypothetical protein